MRVPFDMLLGAFKQSAGARRDAAASIRVAVYVDAGASSFLIETVRGAFVPQTTNGLVRVAPLEMRPTQPKADTDVILVVTSGSDIVQAAVQELVISGAPVVVLAESSVEVPFIERDTPMLGLICATEADHLLDSLASWILSRTEKADAFAANFTFMRSAVTSEIVRSAAVTNAVTGALMFIPGANYPVMTVAQAGMALRLASIHGYKIAPERVYEVAGVAVAGLVFRGAARAMTQRLPKCAFLIRGGVGGLGTLAMGVALNAAYEHGIDYAPLNQWVGSVASKLKGATAASAQQE